AIYFACNQFTAPTWTSFIAEQLDQHERGVYFARRAMIVAGLGFASLCAAGGLLNLWQHVTMAWVGFALIFAVAGAARLFSFFALRPVQDLHHNPTDPRLIQSGFRSFLAQTSQSVRRFFLFSGLMHLAVLIAGPFLVLYMLRDLHFSYLGYGSWLAAGILGQLLTLQAWGRFGDRFGNKALLTITGFSVPFLPMLYIVSAHPVFMMTANFLGGVVWAGLSLGLQNYVLDIVRPEDRAKAVAVNSTVNAIGWSCGALIGSWLVDRLPTGVEISEAMLPFASNLPLVFFISGLLRLGVAASLLGRFHEARAVELAPLPRLLMELPLLKTTAQLVANPFSRLSK
ncbi:MAG TPA: MFS transporter, partial [Nitrospira sp.]